MSQRDQPKNLAKLAGAGLLLYLLLRGGRAWGLGLEPGTGVPVRPRPKPLACFLELLSGGDLLIDGEPGTQAEAVACAREAGVAHVFVQGDAPFGLYVDLREAFEDAGIPLVQALSRGS